MTTKNCSFFPSSYASLSCACKAVDFCNLHLDEAHSCQCSDSRIIICTSSTNQITWLPSITENTFQSMRGTVAHQNTAYAVRIQCQLLVWMQCLTGCDFKENHWWLDIWSMEDHFGARAWWLFVWTVFHRQKSQWLHSDCYSNGWNHWVNSFRADGIDSTNGGSSTGNWGASAVPKMYKVVVSIRTVAPIA